MEIPVFLTHIDPAGAKTFITLDQYNAISTFFLPNVATTGLTVSRTQDPQHCSIRLDVEQDYCLLSVLASQPEPVLVLGNCNIEMPISTNTHQKSIIITAEHQFVTSTGRWQVEWDLSGTISNSMRPPPNPVHEIDMDADYVEPVVLVTDEDGYTLVEQQVLQYQDTKDEEHTRISVTEIRLSPASSHISEEVDPRSLSSGIDTINEATEATGIVNVAETLLNNVEQPRSQVDETLGLNEEEEEKEEGYETDAEDDQEFADATGPQHKTLDGKVGESHIMSSIASQVDGTDNSAPVYGGSNTADKLDSGTPESSHENVIHSHNLELHAIILPENKQTKANEEEDTKWTSEDESHQYRDSRAPKRGLHEIEQNKTPVVIKKRKTDNETPRSITPYVATQEAYEETVDRAAPLTQKSSEASQSLTAKREGPARQKRAHPSQKTKKSERLQPTSLPLPPMPRHPPRRSGIQAGCPFQASGSTQGRPRVIFSSTSKVCENRKVVSVIEKAGGAIVTDIHNADILCVGNDKLKRTCKFIIAVAMGIDIVTDEWVKQAYDDQRLPACKPYLPVDRKQEADWGFSLSEALDRGKVQPRAALLEGTHVYITAQLRKDLGNLFKELKQVAHVLGAESTHLGLPKKTAEGPSLVIGSSKNVDPEATKVHRLNHKLYTQDILTIGALRGKLEMDSDEFVIDVPIKEEPISSQ